MHHPIVVGILLGVAVALAIACALGVAVMRDAMQRLHFPGAVVSLSMLLIVVAVWIDDAAPQPRIKVILVGLLLFLTNPVLSHATARAVRLRKAGHWPREPRDDIPLVHEERPPAEGKQA